MTARLALALVLLAAGCAGGQSPLNPAGPQAERIASVLWWFFGVCGAVYGLTLAALGWALVRRRRQADEAPGTDRRLGWVVVAATAATVVTLVVLTAYSVVKGRGLAAPPGPGAVAIDVIGHQWWWDFRYRGAGPADLVHSPNEMHVPVGVPVSLRVISRDVIHSFWVPSLHGKRDLIPGIVTTTWIQADRPGVYRGQCAEFCGHQHAHMAFLVVAEPMDRFVEWLRHQRRAAAAPRDPLAQRGHDLFMSGPCVMCHTIRGTAAGSRVGPDLTHLAGRRTLAAGTLPMTRGHLAGWVADPQSIKPGVRMPPNLVTGEELQALVAYLESLQ